MKTFDQEIRVEQKHIDKGEHCNAWRCPVALALLDQIDAVETVCVSDNRIEFRVGSDPFVVDTPANVEAAIDEYDRTGRMSPFTFPLVVP